MRTFYINCSQINYVLLPHFTICCQLTISFCFVCVENRPELCDEIRAVICCAAELTTLSRYTKYVSLLKETSVQHRLVQLVNNNVLLFYSNRFEVLLFYNNKIFLFVTIPRSKFILLYICVYIVRFSISKWKIRSESYILISIAI